MPERAATNPVTNEDSDLSKRRRIRAPSVDEQLMCSCTGCSRRLRFARASTH
jgi:hypothetical protein